MKAETLLKYCIAGVCGYTKPNYFFITGIRSKPALRKPIKIPANVWAKVQIAKQYLDMANLNLKP